MKKIIALVFIATMWGCSAAVDTTSMSPEEHYKYAMELYNDEDYDVVVNEFQTIILQHPGSTVNDDAQFYLGMTYFKREQFLLSAYEFSKLIRDIPASQYVPESQFMLADAYYQLSPPYQLDQVYTKKAISEFQAFIDFFPLNEKVKEAEDKINELNNKLAEKEYRSAVIYEKMEYNTAAIEYYENIVDTYHDTMFAPMALYNKIKLELSKDRTGDALRDCSEFISRYPNDERASEIAELQESLLSSN